MEKNRNKPYREFKLEEFVLDTRFQRWVQDGKDRIFWERFMQQFPEKQEEIKEARKLVENLGYRKIHLDQKYKESQLEAIYREIGRRKHKTKPIFRRHFYLSMASAAAVLFLLISSLVYWFVIKNDYQEYYAGFKETRNIQLADGTEVMLNANSSLKSFTSLKENEPREVWLKGEAFFDVKHLNTSGSSKKFIVHTSKLDIEVLGTKFNVKNRERNTRVFLEEGAVKVGLKTSKEKMLMNPGEMVELGSENEQLEKKLPANKAELAWQNNQFVFENTKLEQVAQEIEYYYGKKVIFQGEKLKEEIFTAKVSRDNRELLLKLLRESFTLEIKETKDAIYLKEK